MWPLGRIGDLGRGPLVAVLLLSPLVAAVFVWIGDALWVAVSGRKKEPKADPGS